MSLRQTNHSEGNNASDQGARCQRELTLEALWEMSPRFCLPLFTTGLMKKKMINMFIEKEAIQ